MNASLLVYRFASAWREGIRKMMQRIVTAILAAVVAGLLIGASVARGQDSTSAVAAKVVPATTMQNSYKNNTRG